MNNIQPLRKNWRIEEDSGVHPADQILERVRSEDNYTNSKGYPLIKEVEGRKGKAIEVIL